MTAHLVFMTLHHRSAPTIHYPGRRDRRRTSLVQCRVRHWRWRARAGARPRGVGACPTRSQGGWRGLSRLWWTCPTRTAPLWTASLFLLLVPTLRQSFVLPTRSRRRILESPTSVSFSILLEFQTLWVQHFGLHTILNRKVPYSSFGMRNIYILLCIVVVAMALEITGCSLYYQLPTKALIL